MRSSDKFERTLVEAAMYAIYCSEKDAQNFIEFSQVFGPEFKCEIYLIIQPARLPVVLL